MHNIRVLAHGLEQKEPVGESVDRPSGFACYSFVRFHSAMQVLTEQGMVAAHPGNCILLAPNYPHAYSGTDGEWSNDWMHFVGDKVQLYSFRYGVPFNTLLAPPSTNFLPVIFEEITSEQRFQMDCWDDAIELLMYQFLFKLGRELKEKTMMFTPTEMEHLTSLRDLRQQLHCNLEKSWTVDKMAKSVNLSVSRFAVLYQQFFGVSPMEDLVRSRIRHAQYLLTNRPGLVSDISKRCGYKNVGYFSTVFQKRVGCSPSHFQRQARRYYQNERDVNHD